MFQNIAEQSPYNGTTEFNTKQSHAAASISNAGYFGVILAQHVAFCPKKTKKASRRSTQLDAAVDTAVMNVAGSPFNSFFPESYDTATSYDMATAKTGNFSYTDHMIVNYHRYHFTSIGGR